MSSSIRILPEHLVNQIAAGEVIERPASVVKELVENAIDAKSTVIDVELIDAGKTKIRVSDNGMGMTPEEAMLSIKRHATSKIKELDDLFHVKSLGFRGEALPSIASVSRFQMTTRPPTSAEAVTLRLTGGKEIQTKVSGAPVGTEIVVEALFFNTPARLKFLKSPATELSRTAEVMTPLALAYPKISFRLTHQGRQRFYYGQVASPRERALSILQEKQDTLLPIEEAHEGWQLYGFAAIPSVWASSSRWCLTIVNGRPVRDRTILHAVTSAYQSVMAHGAYPKAALFLESPAGAVDVNVHPAKREVRFKNTPFVHGFVEQSLKRALQRQTPSLGVRVEGGTFIREPQQESAFFSFRAPSDNRPELPRRYATFTYIGQVKNSYILCEDETRLIFIDQHAAHERVMFEKLKKDFKEEAMRPQYLLVPLALDLSPEEAILVEENSGNLQKLGFEMDHFGDKTYVVKAVPPVLMGEVSAEMIRAILNELSQMPKSLVGEELIHHRLSTIACHSARTAKEKLEPREVYALLASIDRLEAAPHCPHGRPFSFSIPIQEIEKRFHR